jgi:hypothetical protein
MQNFTQHEDRVLTESNPYSLTLIYQHISLVS